MILSEPGREGKGYPDSYAPVPSLSRIDWADDAASNTKTQRRAAGKQSVMWYLGLRRLGGVGEGPILKAVISKNASL